MTARRKGPKSLLRGFSILLNRIALQSQRLGDSQARRGGILGPMTRIRSRSDL